MAHAEQTVTIQRPITEVFQFILDGENNKLWRHSVTEIKRTTSKPDKVGAKFMQRNKGPCGRQISADYEITECENNRVVSFKVTSGPARPLGTFVLEQAGSGTKVTFKLHYEPRGFAKLMDSMINKTMQSEVAALSEMKVYLEAKK
jgi:uncharacterized membrane protein